MWVSIGILILFLLIGLIAGLVRGLKRSSLHLLFLVVSVVVSFFITKPITKAILGITIPIDGQNYTISEYIISMIQTNFDISQFETATEFLERLPNAIVSPIMFILLTLVVFLIFDIIYLIVARLAFGKKKKDFEKTKPYRAYGGIIGMVEGFLFLFVLFAPLTSLTKTYEELVQLPPAQTQTLEVNAEEGEELTPENSKMKSIAETLNEMIPPEVSEIILAYNDSVVGKIAGAGGLDNALFDGLSNFEIDGEKIELRKEILTVADVYDEVAVVYNSVIDQNYISIDLTNLKANLEKFLNNGLFKTVISDTINDIVVNFETLKEELNLQELPQIAQDIINDLYTRFTSVDFDAYEYLKHDILSIVDVADELFKSGLISEFENINKEDMLTSVLNLISDNSLSIKKIAQNVLQLNLVDDTFETLGEFASEAISENLQNDQGLEIALNTNIENKEQMIDDILQAVDDFISINEKVDISAMMQAENPIEYLSNLNDLENVLTQLGTTLDNVRTLEIIVLPANGETRPNDVYVLDNILTLYDFNLLGDEVYLTPEDETTTKLDTYTKFVNFVKTPILELQKIDLSNLGEGGDFDVLLDSVLTGLEENPNLLSDMLLPIYQLKVLNLNELFNQLVDQLGSEENTNGLISIDKIKEDAAVAEKNGVMVWDEELKYLGEVLISLNKGSVGVDNQTYLKALLSGTTEMEDVLNAMIEDNVLSETLDPVFSARAFEGLTNQIFDMIDQSISEITRVQPDTSLTNLKSEKAEVIEIISNLLSTVTGDTELTLEQLGIILDELKVNAYNDGAKDGVFNEIFANIIWYMTGENITQNPSYETDPTNDFFKDVKGYLGVSGAEGYYTYASYEQTLSELDGVIDFAAALADSVSDITLSNETIVDYVANIKGVIDGMTDKSEEEIVETINNLKHLIDTSESRDGLLSSEDKQQYGDSIKIAIETAYGTDSEIGTALKLLFDVA